MIVELQNLTGVDTRLVHLLPVGTEIVANRPDDRRAYAEESQVMANVSSHAARNLAQRVDQKTDRDDVGLVRDDVICQRSAK